MPPFILYGMPHSLYSGKARAYLIKQNINFKEVTAGHPDYMNNVMPKIGRWIIPVLQTPDGELVQDGSDIINWFEGRKLARLPAYPATARQLLVALIFELFGGEGLLRPAMHYRWNFDPENKDFIEDQFGLFRMPTMTKPERAEIVEKSTSRMRAAGVMFGVTEETIPAIEAAYEEFLRLLDAHFSVYPYLLGGVPTIGDYGLIASLYAHLGRDPHPASLMKRIAPAVFRWTERMNAANADIPEFIDTAEEILTDDFIPDSLKPILSLIARDYLPEIEAFVGFTNNWLTGQPDLGSGDTVGGDAKARAIGSCTFTWSGHELTVGVLPYRIYLLQKIQDAFDRCETQEKDKIEILLAETGLEPLLTIRCTRRVERRDNREIWGEENR
ncbi:glutathione S-transferase [Sneathiella marina]|uniref:Glutathione S-transferase n=1 Tax=Sneathiella marina TaxID=2950108 RepID=A0ABY4W7S1_9PROT|nr:glutathione S-transferase N-terminal domain-containing protein [Sneathiella marina]USG62849.1 glutathione S-transferase [Sneathiella marina]